MSATPSQTRPCRQERALGGRRAQVCTARARAEEAVGADQPATPRFLWIFGQTGDRLRAGLLQPIGEPGPQVRRGLIEVTL